MFDILIWACLTLAKVAGLGIILYLFYWRVIDYAHCVWFYGRQGREVCALTPGHMPMFGNLFQVI